MNRRFRLATLVVCALSAFACDVQKHTGSARIFGTVQTALQSASVSRVVVTVSGSGISPDLTVDLTRTGSSWNALLGGIPAGTGRTFTAVAYDAGSQALYSGAAANQTVQAGKTILVSILLQSLNPPPAFQDASPIIDALTASNATPQPGEVVTLTAIVHDPDPADTLDKLTESWADTTSAPNAAGAFSGTTTTLTATWIAPATAPSDDTLVFTVTDPLGQFAAQAVTLQVRSQAQQGGADVTAVLNFFPTVANVTVSPTRIQPGNATQADVVASDPDNDQLTYAWSTPCAGTFLPSSTVKSPAFTPTAQPAGGACTLTVAVDDGRGGTNHGDITFSVGDDVTVSWSPQIDSTTQSGNSALGSEVIEIDITAHDPAFGPGAISYAWSTTAGAATLVDQAVTTDGAGHYTGVAHFGAFNCSAGNTTLSVTATNAAHNATTTRAFTVRSCPVSCKELLAERPGTPSGVYFVKPDGLGGNPNFATYCDMETDGGGWTFAAHVNGDFYTSNIWQNDVGSFRADRVDDDTTYTKTGALMPYIGHTEMMIALGGPDPATAAGASSLVTYHYALGDAAFNDGPIQCATGAGFEYRFTTAGPFTPGGFLYPYCSSGEWYASDVSGAYLAMLIGAPYPFRADTLGFYWGQGMGGDASWNHDGWIYLR